jgi:hypothetical protein
MTAGFRAADIALPSFGDEQALHGDESPEATVARIAALGPSEIAVKDGPAPVRLRAGGGARAIAVPPVATVVDTTAAGDAFNAGYLASRIAGQPPERAARVGIRLSQAKLAHRGAVMPREAMPRRSARRMKLELGVAALVLLSALLHASWNAVVKSDADRLLSFGLVMIMGTAMGLAAAPVRHVFRRGRRGRGWPPRS